MDKYSGRLHEIGSASGGVISNIGIGDTTLRKVRTVRDVWQALVPGRDVDLYTYRHLFFRHVLLGVRDRETGEKTLMPADQARNSCIQLFVLHGLGWIFGTLIVGGMLASFVGMNPESIGGLLALIGLGIGTYLTARMWLDFRAAVAD
jgi:hypothetical protein